MGIFRVEQLGTKKSLKNLIVMISVTVWNVAHLMLIVILVWLNAASFICSVGARQTLLWKYKLLLFKIQSETIIGQSLWDEAIIFGGLWFGWWRKFRNIRLHLLIDLSECIGERHTRTFLWFDGILLHIQILGTNRREANVAVWFDIIEMTLPGSTCSVLIWCTSHRRWWRTAIVICSRNFFKTDLDNVLFTEAGMVGVTFGSTHVTFWVWGGEFNHDLLIACNRASIFSEVREGLLSESPARSRRLLLRWVINLRLWLVVN